MLHSFSYPGREPASRPMSVRRVTRPAKSWPGFWSVTVIPPAQVLREEALGRAVQVDLVLRVHEAVSLVLLDHVLDLDPAGAERFDDVVGLGLHDAHVVRSLGHHQRR